MLRRTSKDVTHCVVVFRRASLSYAVTSGDVTSTLCGLSLC